MHSKNRRILFGTMAAIAALGIINASYLAYIAFLGEAPTCLLKSGCDIVAASPYARVAGVPLALFGVFFYTLVAGFSVWAFAKRDAPVKVYLLGLTALGFLLSLYFLYLQAFAIKAYCEYCLFSLLDSCVLFGMSIFIFRTKRDILKPLPSGITQE